MSWPKAASEGADMCSEVGGRVAARRYVAWQTCTRDGRDHAVTDEEFARGRRTRSAGRYGSVCGHVVVVGSMLLPPAPLCAACHAIVFASSALPSTQRARPNKASLWSRLRGHRRPQSLRVSAGGAQ